MKENIHITENKVPKPERKQAHIWLSDRLRRLQKWLEEPIPKNGREPKDIEPISTTARWGL